MVDGMLTVEVLLARPFAYDSEGRAVSFGEALFVSKEKVASLSREFKQASVVPAKKRTALREGQFSEVDDGDIDFELESPNTFFGTHANLIPLQNSVAGSRIFYGARFMNQALPLTNPEAPYVQALVDGDKDGRSFDDLLGESAGAKRSKKGGRVSAIDSDGMDVDYDDGEKGRIDLYNGLPFNRKSSYTQTSLLKPGDVFKPGQLVAKSNYTDGNGTLALGLNARVGLVPYLGKSMDDAVVVSESFAKRLCFDKVTEVLTLSGWKMFKDVSLNDELACLVDGKIVYQHPLAVNSDITQRFVEASGRMFDIRVTPDHCLFVSKSKNFDFKKVPAELLCSNVRIKLRRNCQNIYPDVSFFHLPGVVLGRKSKLHKSDWHVSERTFAMDAWCSLFGLWVAEGFAEFIKATNGGRICVVAYKRRVKKELSKISLALGIGKFSGERWFAYGRQLHDYFAQFGHAQNKYLPDWVWSLSQRQCRILLHSMCLGDGCFSNADDELSETSVFYSTSSKRLADDVQRLALHAGYSANVWIHSKAGSEHKMRDGRIVRQNFDNYGLVVTKSNPHLNTSSETQLRIVETDIPELVWCVTTQAGVIYVRRNGKPRWCGNCSDHLYGHDMDFKRGVKPGKGHYMGIFPNKFTTAQLKKLDDDGVVQVGQRLEPGDPLILATRPRVISSANSQLGLLSKHMKNARSDAAAVWDHDTPGFVTDVKRLHSGVKVNVRTSMPTQVGDKIVNRSGQKGTISTIIPDSQMPRTVDGQPLEILLNQLGLPSRVNNSLVYELLLGKVAHKTGKPYRLPTFNKPNENWYDFVADELKKNGINSTEEVFDPQFNRKLEKPITVGNAYVLKLHHTSESKMSTRGQGSYSKDEQPLHGGAEAGGAKRMSGLETAALMSSGAYNVLREGSTLRGQKNDSYWRDLRMGYSPKEPGTPFIWDKFKAMLVGAGYQAKKMPGGKERLTFFTDKDLDKVNPIEVKNGELVDISSMDPVPGGLFDSAITGSNSWGAITLPTALPNPAAEGMIVKLLGLTRQQYRDILSGEAELPAHLQIEKTQ